MMKSLLLILFSVFSLLLTTPVAAQDSPVVLTKDMLTERGIVLLSELGGWLFRFGDGDDDRLPENSDTTWIDLRPADFRPMDYYRQRPVEGWFRFTFMLDSSMAEIPLGWRIATRGAARFYLDGNPVANFGNPHTDKSQHINHNFLMHAGEIVILQPDKPYQLSIYYVDHYPYHITRFKTDNFIINPHFALVTDKYLNWLDQNSRRFLIFNTVWLTALLSLSILFWVLYMLNRNEKGLITIAATTTSLFALAFFQLMITISTGLYSEVAIYLFSLAGAMLIGLIPMVITRILMQKIPALVNIFFVVVMAFGLIHYFLPFASGAFPILFTFALSFYYIYKSRKTIRRTQWIVIGGLILTVLWLLAYMVYYAFYIYAAIYLASWLNSAIMLTLPVSLLVYVALRFTEILNETKTKANEIVELTKKKLRAEQETHKILENQKQLLEVEVEKRTAELQQSLEDLRNTQNQLVHAEKMASLGELTAGIAHEIQNPLNFVNNFAEVSGELIDEADEELAVGNGQLAKEIIIDIRQNLEKIHHHGKRADAIVKGMLQHSRTNSGQKELTDINALADEYLRLSYHGLRAKDKSFNADFKTEFDPNLPKVNVIPQDIGRVLLNLINNAFYAVHEKTLSGLKDDFNPTVTISTKNLGDRIEISVKDNGPGIPEEIKNKIFQPFFTTKPTGQGTGLGLSLSYDIAKAHGGEIRVSSTENQGTEFIIVLKTN
jgi:two-component system, NtrC family, sensor kinase